MAERLAYQRAVTNPNDHLDGGIIGIDMYHHKVHAKELYNLTHHNLTLSDNGYLTLGITVPEQWEIHLFNVSMFGVDVPFLGELYPYCTFTTGSTFLIPLNHYNREDTIYNALTTFNTDPTGFVSGGRRSYSYWGGGSGIGGSNSSGIFHNSGEWVLHGGKHLIRVQNLTGGATLTQISLNFYEVMHFD